MVKSKLPPEVASAVAKVITPKRPRPSASNVSEQEPALDSGEKKITPHELINPQGFYPLGSNEVSIWSGPGLTASFLVDIPNDRPYHFELGLSGRPDRPTGMDIQLKVDNVYIDITRRSADGQTIGGVILPRKLPGLRKISFVVDSTFVPARFNPEYADVRQLGVALHLFKYWPV